MTRKRPSIAFLQLVAIASAALCLVPSGTHFFELLNKMELTPQDYMIVQKIYAGWAGFGAVILLAVLATMWHTVVVRDHPLAFRLSLTALLGVTATLAVYWILIDPVNVASHDWTVTPEPFETARRQWEYGHAANAVIMFTSFLALAGSVIVYEEP